MTAATARPSLTHMAYDKAEAIAELALIEAMVLFML
jgi:hypothetical protein